MQYVIGNDIRRCLAVLMLLAASFGSRGALAESKPFKRWAVVGDRALRDVGLSDLVTAKLSEFPKIEMIEREQLQRIVRELTFASGLLRFLHASQRACEHAEKGLAD